MIEVQPWLNDGEVAMSGVLAGMPASSPAARTRAGERAAAPSTSVRLPALQRACIAETRHHARRLAAFATALGRHLQLPEADLGVLYLGGLLHDVGKHALPAELLLKCGRLSAEEFAAVRYHPVIGDLLCARVPALQPVRPIVRHHHERLDGSGYPDRLRGNEIPLHAQIAGVADVYDALVCTRSYKPAYDSAHAFDILRREVELGWRRADLVAAFIETIERGEADWLLVAAAV